MKRCILVVDDDDTAREMTARSLQMTTGWEVLEAYCGVQGIECAAARQPDMILLDVMMPAMDGPAMISKLKASRSTAHIPVVLLTAKPNAARSIARLPVEAIFSKPLDPSKFAQRVAEVLGWSDGSF